MNSNDGIPAPGIQPPAQTAARATVIVCGETTPAPVSLVKYVRLPPQTKVPVSSIHRQGNA